MPEHCLRRPAALGATPDRNAVALRGQALWPGKCGVAHGTCVHAPPPSAPSAWPHGHVQGGGQRAVPSTSRAAKKPASRAVHGHRAMKPRVRPARPGGGWASAARHSTPCAPATPRRCAARATPSRFALRPAHRHRPPASRGRSGPQSPPPRRCAGQQPPARLRFPPRKTSNRNNNDNSKDGRPPEQPRGSHGSQGRSAPLRGGAMKPRQP